MIAEKKIKLFHATLFLALAGWGFFFTHATYAANLYAQFNDGQTTGAGFGVMSDAYTLAAGQVKYVQVELDITNDEQRGPSYYCPFAPNTGVLVFIYQNGNFAYAHCITSAEAAGKLGHKALYTFSDANFGFGGTAGFMPAFQADGAFNAQIYGSASDGGFSPYLILGDAEGISSPTLISGLTQYFLNTTDTIPENGIVTGNALNFTGIPQSFFASDTLAFQVEVQPFSIPFAGVPTATSTPVLSGAVASTTVSGLSPGPYHWQGRAVDTVTGDVSSWTEFRAVGNIDFNIPTTTPEREPIVIVPGALGSALDRVSDGEEVWPNVTKMILSGSDSYLNDLKLTSTGMQTTAIATGDILRQELDIFSGYQNLIQSCQDVGYEESSTLFVAPYDWRQSIASSAQAIAPIIARALAHSPYGKINIIAHSMGGLVVKEYLAAATSTTLHDLIFIGVPQLGSPATFKVLNYGDDLGMGWLGVGLNQAEAKAITQNMPGIYQLLPSRKYIDANGGYIQDFRNGGSQSLNYDQTSQLMTSDPADARNPTMLASADLLHKAMDGQPASTPNIYNIVGCLIPTVSRFDLYDNGVVKLMRTTGDGTIPEASAVNLANGANNYFVLGDETGIDHLGLVNDVRPLQLIKDILDDATGTSPLPQGISGSLADCTTPRPQIQNETTIAFSTHSPVALNVYDAEHRHTGPTVNGDFELGIPGSTYEKIGENTFVLVPAGQTYTVLDQGLASGTLEMDIDGYRGSTLDNEVQYLSVPIAGPSTSAELNFSNFSGDMGLKLDSDGDHVTDAVIFPSDPPSSSTFSATADSYIEQDAPNMNYGGLSGLRVGGTESSAAVVNFDIGRVKAALASSTIVSAKLIFTTALKGNETGMLKSFPLSQLWSELGVTENCPDEIITGHKMSCGTIGPWNFPSMATASTTLANMTSTIVFDVTDDVKNILKGILPGDGWLIAQDAAGGASANMVGLAARESKSGPRLVVTYGTGYTD